MTPLPRPLARCAMPGRATVAALAAIALLAGASAAGHAAVVVNPTIDAASVEATGSAARLAFRTTGSNLSLGGRDGAALSGHLAPASGNANRIHDNWISFALSFDAASALFSWTLSGAGLAPVTLQQTESATFDSLRLDFHVANRHNTLSWDDLSFVGLPVSGAMPGAGSVSNGTVSHWLAGAGADALSLHSWTLSGRALATGGHGEQVRLGISPMTLAPVSAIPEPRTGALLLAGLALTALLSRRRIGR